MIQWPDPPPPGHIHVWMCGGVTDGRCDEHLPRLSADERERAAAFRFDADRRRFTGARFLLRSVLAHYHHCARSDLQFATGDRGKPVLSSPCTISLPFNLSRSHEVALLAVSGGGEVGVDVEFHREERADPVIVKRQFSEPEQEHITRSSDPKASFYEIWTRKEAYIKALGRGLSHPLGDFDTTPTPGDPVTLVRDWSEASPTEGWHVQNLSFSSPHYSFGLATSRRPHTIDLLPVTLAALEAGAG